MAAVLVLSAMLFAYVIISEIEKYDVKQSKKATVKK
jgi:hypothetical protein